jgi:hypothetical protein
MAQIILVAYMEVANVLDHAALVIRENVWNPKKNRKFKITSKNLIKI